MFFVKKISKSMHGILSEGNGIVNANQHQESTCNSDDGMLSSKKRN